jgi:hypothetical protein
MSQKTIARLERLQQLNSNQQWMNRDLYRLMYREDLYIIAYERIKSKPGNMTPGTDEQTLDGWLCPRDAQRVASKGAIKGERTIAGGC